MPRSWIAPRPLASPALVAAVLAAALLVPPPPPATAQAGMEAALLTGQSVRTLTGQPGVVGPAWSPSRRRAAALAAPLTTPRRRGPVPVGIRGRRAGAPEPPPLLVRPASGAPGKVAGLVYERGTKVPLPNVIVSLVSTEPQYVVTRLTARTDSAGYYEFPAVEPGRWSLWVPRDGLPMTHATPRVAPAITLAKRQAYAAPAFALGKQACVEGRAVWGDGYPLFDAPVTIVPLDTTLNAVGGQLDGIGDYKVCEAADDSVMIWMHLRDGRSLGRAARLTPGSSRRIEFKPEPIERMEGSPLRVLPVLADGTPVPRAQILVVGRRFEQGDRPALVFVREDASDRDGVAELKVPFGNYEVLVINPREGQAGTERMVVDIDQGQRQPLRVVLRGSHSPAQQEAMKTRLLEHAETSLFVWGQ